MAFDAPLVLLALLLVAAGVAAYVVVARRRSRRAAAFANPALLVNVAPSAPGARRHVPPALLSVALAALIVAAAKPHATVAVPDERASILLVTDVSGSMTATDVAPTRLRAAREAAQRFVDDVPRAVRVGVMAFNQRPHTLQRPTRERAAVHRALDRLDASGGTATGEALKAALQLLRPPLPRGAHPAPAAVVLLSDGASVRGRDPVAVAAEARRARVPVYTVALGTAGGTIQVPRPNGQGTVTRAVPPDPATLARIARVSGGEAYTADDADQLGAVYGRLGSQVGTKKQRREVSYAFVGGALALLVAGAASSLAVFGRLL
jgi:Ca-activated chloride channel family protein